MRCDITVKLELAGWHSWPSAPAHRAYLASLHRHLFHVTATVRVFHDDRDVEFHDLSDEVAAWWGDATSRWDRGSCEQMARSLHVLLTDRYGTEREVVVSVGEDGEAWATVQAA